MWPKIVTHITRLAIVILLGNLAVAAACGLCLVSIRPDTPSWDDLERFHDIVYPHNATDLVYSIGQNRNFWVRLSFKAPPESAMAFANHFCGGIFHQGYDPFNTVDTREPSRVAHLIKVWPGYYSYSPSAPKTYFGNRCEDKLGFDIEILIDRTLPNQYAVKFDLPGRCGNSTGNIPCYSPYYRFLTPIDDFNMFIITGIEKSGSGEWSLNGEEMCIETFNLFQDAYKEYVGSSVDISIDGHAMPSGYISQEQRFVFQEDVNTDGTSKRRGEFNYCLNENWPNGLHVMDIQVNTKLGAMYLYLWKFRVDYLWL